MIEFEDIIQKTRRGEVILWIGSGFSKIAGYPTGNELANLIKEKLNRNEKKYFKKKFSLDEVAEEFVQMRSREELISILNDVFKKEPINLMYHRMISEIPQIRTIITTNYDKSFELTYKTDISTIISDKDIPAAARNKVHLYKIHGDIDTPNSIMITKKDYSNYYKEGRESLLWTAVKSLVSRHSILFVGYSFADSNIQSIFEYILERLGDSHKDYYLITTRNLPPYKRKDLLERYSIHYIQMSAEDAISSIQEAVETNLIIDTKHGYIPKHLINKTYSKRYINTRFSVGDEGKLILDSITSLEGGPQITFNMELTARSETINKINELNDIICGNKFGKFTLYQDDCIINVSAKAGKCLLFDPKYSSVSSITISSNPNMVFSASLILYKSNLCFNNLKGERYSSISTGEIRLSHDGFNLTIKFIDASKPEINFHLSIHTGKDIILGYEVYRFFNTWIEEDELQIYYGFSDKPHKILFSELDVAKKEVQSIKEKYNFYSKIFRIQREFGVHFRDISNLIPDDITTLNKIIYLLDGGKFSRTGKNVSVKGEIIVDDKEQLLTDLDKKEFSLNHGPFPLHYTFLGTDIVLDCGYSVQGTLINKQDIISKLNQGFNISDLEVDIKNETYYIADWKLLKTEQASITIETLSQK
jgi:hypothetical protein